MLYLELQKFVHVVSYQKAY